MDRLRRLAGVPVLGWALNASFFASLPWRLEILRSVETAGEVKGRVLKSDEECNDVGSGLAPQSGFMPEAEAILCLIRKYTTLHGIGEQLRTFLSQ